MCVNSLAATDEVKPGLEPLLTQGEVENAKRPLVSQKRAFKTGSLNSVVLRQNTSLLRNVNTDSYRQVAQMK